MMSHHHFEGIRQSYIASYVAGSGGGLAQLFTDDCMMLPPDESIAAGKAGVQAFYEQQFAQMEPSSLSITAEEEAVMGDWGYGMGTFAVTASLKAGGAPVKIEGKYLNVMKRQADGGWKIHRHTWNAPTQLAALAAHA